MTVPYDVIADVMGVIDRISRGKVPTVACDEQGLSYSTFNTYTGANSRYPDLITLRVEAEDRLYDQMAEALPHIYNHPIYGVDDPKMAGVVSSNMKWLLARRRRDAYGEHSTIEHKITADREVLDALQKAKARAQTHEPRAQSVIIDGTVNQITGSVIDITVIEEDLSSLY